MAPSFAGRRRRQLVRAAALLLALMLLGSALAPAVAAAADPPLESATPWVPEKTPYLSDLFPINENSEWIDTCVFPRTGSYKPGTPVPSNVEDDARKILLEKATDDEAGGDAPDGETLNEQYQSLAKDDRNRAKEFLRTIIAARLTRVPAARRDAVSALIDERATTWSAAAAPYQLSGCQSLLGESQTKLSIKEIFGGGLITFLVKVITLPIWLLQNALYDLSAKLFVHYGLFTPHVERGETITNLIACETVSNDPGCASIRERGFNDPVGSDASADASVNAMKGAGWIKIMLSLRYLVASVFTLTLLGACVLWMVRGSESRNLHLLRLVPRLVLASMLLIALPALIGFAITLSNQVTQAIFTNETCGAAEVACSARAGLVSAMVQLRDTADSANGVGADIGSAAQVLISIVVGGISTFFVLLLTLVTVARQLTIAGLIAMMPFAVGALLLDSGQKLFEKWWKLIAAMLLVPPAMGIVLRIGIAMNPVIDLTGQARQVGFTEWLLGAMIWLATLYAMWKTLPMLRKWATGSGQGMLGKGIAKAAPVAGAAAGTALGNPMLGAKIGGAVGGMADSAGNASLMPSRAEGQLARGAASIGGWGAVSAAGGKAGGKAVEIGAGLVAGARGEEHLERSETLRAAINQNPVADAQLIERMKQANARHVEETGDVDAALYTIRTNADGTEFGSVQAAQAKTAWEQDSKLVSAIAAYQSGGAQLAGIAPERGSGGDQPTPVADAPPSADAAPPPAPLKLPIPIDAPAGRDLDDAIAPSRQESAAPGERMPEADALDESRARRKPR